MSRHDDIRKVLENIEIPISVNEIGKILHVNPEDMKYVSSFLTRAVKKGTVVRTRGVCRLSGRECWLYRADIHSGTHSAGNRARNRASDSARNRKAEEPRAKASQRPGSWAGTKTGPTAEERAKARQKAEEARRKAERERNRRPPQRDPWSVFAQFTGYSGRDQAGMKRAFRKAALDMHPDRGGNHNDFAMLSGAWDTIQRYFGD